MGDFKNVAVDAEPAGKTGQIDLIFKVEEHPVIKKIDFVGNKKWDSKKFMDDIKSALNKPFNQGVVNQDMDIIRKDYQDEGYSNVVVTSEHKVDETKNTVEVTFKIV